jgi:hypothetical protein
MTHRDLRPRAKTVSPICLVEAQARIPLCYPKVEPIWAGFYRILYLETIDVQEEIVAYLRSTTDVSSTE